MRALVEGVIRYAVNYWGIPYRNTSAICDACGTMQIEVEATRARSVAILRQDGWLVEHEWEGAACLCPVCTARLWRQIWRA